MSDQKTNISQTSISAAYIAIFSAAAVLLLLSILHILSPELDPAWRVISEYANGQYPWVLSLMFIFGAISSWALFFAIKSQIKTKAGKVGLFFLILSGIGPAMASVFDINHPLHNLAGIIGTLSLVIAAMLISISLSRKAPWAAFKKSLLWTANLNWITLVLFIATTALLGVTYMQSGATMPAEGQSLPLGATLPSGVVAINGWINRLMLVASSLWIITVGWLAIKIKVARR